MARETAGNKWYPAIQNRITLLFQLTATLIAYHIREVDIPVNSTPRALYNVAFGHILIQLKKCAVTTRLVSGIRRPAKRRVNMPKMTCLVGLVLLMNVRACVVLIDYDDKLQGETDYSESPRPILNLVAGGEDGSQFAVLRVSHGGGELPIQVNVGAILGEGFSLDTDMENICEVGTVETPAENELAPKEYCLIGIEYQSQNIGHKGESTVIVTPGNGALGLTNSWRLIGHTVAPSQLTLAPQTTNDFGFVSSGHIENLLFDVIYSGASPASVDVAATEASLPAPFGFAGGAFPGTAGTCGTQIDSDCTLELAFSPATMGIYEGGVVLHYHNGVNVSTTDASLVGLGDEEISFASAYVENVTRNFLDKLPGEPIYFSETQTITSFHLWGDDLLDVHYFPNLTEIFLAYVDSTDLMAIAELKKLTYIFCTEHSLTDLSVFANFNQLHTLRIEYGGPGNYIDDLSPLAALPSLKFLQFFGTNVINISGLDGLTLDFLDLHHCDVLGLGSLADSESFFAAEIDLRESYFNCNSSEDLASLSKLRYKGMTVVTHCEEPSPL